MSTLPQSQSAPSALQQPRPSPAPAAKPKKSFLSNVITGAVKSPGFMLIYGLPGIGKSTFAADAERPVFIDTENGSSKLGVARMPNVESWEDVKGAIAELTSEDHPYKTLVLDTVDGLESWMSSHVCKQANKANLTAFGFNKGPDIVLDEWRALVALIERLQRARGMRVILVGHSVVRGFKNPEGEGFDYYTPKLNEKAWGFLVERVDTVLFARQEVFVRSDKDGARARGISTGTHVVHTTRNAAYVAKNRDHLPDMLPLDWAAYATAVERQAPADLSEMMGEISGLIERIPDAAKPLVQKDIETADGNAAVLMRILNRLRATVRVAEGESAR